jgi:hypothetical protein
VVYRIVRRLLGCPLVRRPVCRLVRHPEVTIIIIVHSQLG